MDACNENARTRGNPGGVQLKEEESQWILGGVMAMGGLSNCLDGFPFWMTSAEFFLQWINCNKTV